MSHLPSNRVFGAADTTNIGWGQPGYQVHMMPHASAPPPSSSTIGTAIRTGGKWLLCPSDRELTIRYPFPVFALRRFLLVNRHLAALVCVAALATKLLVPSGYMVSPGHGRIAITICSGVDSGSASMDMPGMQTGADHGQPKEHGKAEMPCAFSSLLAQALAAADAVLLIAAAAFLLRLGRLPARAAARPVTRYLRPPSRGPPASF